MPLSLLPTNVANETNTASVPLAGALAVIAHSDVGSVSGVSGVSDAARSDRWHVVCLPTLEQIREFVRWWDEGVKSRGNPEKKGSDLKSADRRKLNMADAESMTGISNQQVSRWRKRIKDEAA